MNDRNNNRHGHSASIRVEETDKTRPQYTRYNTHLPHTGHHDGGEDDGVELLVPSSLFSTQLTQISDEDGNHADGAYAAHQESKDHHHHNNKGVHSFMVKHSSAARKRKHASILLAPDDETQVYIPEDKTEEEEDSGIEDSKGLDNADAEDRDRHGWTTQISSFGIKDVDETSPRHASRITSAAASTLTTATVDAHSSPAYYRTTSSLLDTIMMLSDEPSIGETPCVMIKKKGGGKATTAMQQQQLEGKQRAAYRRRQRAQEVEKGEEEDGTNTVSKRRNRNEVVAGSSDDGDYDSGSSNQNNNNNNNNSSNNKSNYYNIVASSSIGAGAVHVEGGQHIPQSPMSPSIRRVRLERLQELEKKRNAMLRQRQRREQQALEKKRQLLLQQQKLAERKQVGENKQQKIIKKAVRAEVQKRKNDESSDESFSEDDDFDDEDDEQVSANDDYESINKRGEERWWCQPRATRGRKGSRYILTAPSVSNFIGNEIGAHGRNYERDWEGGNDFDEEEARDRRRVHALLFGETRCQVINCADSTILPRGRHQYHIGESCENNEQEGGETAKPSRSEFLVSPRSKHTTGQSGNTVLAPASRCNTNNSAMRILAYDNPRVVVVPMALSNNAPVPGKPVFVKPAPRGNVRQKCRKQESEGKSSEEEKRGTVEEKAKNGREAEVKKKRDMNVNKGWWARPANVGFYDIGHLIFSDHTKGVDDHRLEDGQAASGSRVDTSGGEVCLAGGGGMATKRPRVETSASVAREGSLRLGRDRGSGGGRRSRRTFEPADFISLTKPLLASDVTLVGFKSFDFSVI